MNRTIRRSASFAAAAVLSLSLVACGSEDDGDDTSSGSDDTTSETTTEDSPSASESDDMASGAGAETFGEGCSSIPTTGDGSFDGMVDDPVATAASNNPLLKTLVAAVGSVEGLGDTLNGAPALTVFAPYDPAFEEIPKKDLNGLIAEAQEMGQDSALYSILAHHVLGANNDPMAVAGEQETLAGDTLTVEGDAESGMTVSDGTVTATVLCGNIPTANATVYVIDKVLTGVK